jgi:cell pole-organizing protein PopZ
MRGAALILSLAMWAGVAQSACRQALAIGLDVSGSVDAREYRLQIDGLATALDSAKVRQALLMMPGVPVELLIYEWSGPEDPAVILPWTAVTSAPVLDAVIGQLRATQRRQATPGTALGLAMRKGAAHLAERAECWKRTLDLSGDGKSNLGPRPVDIKPEIEGTGVTINALVIGVDSPTADDLRQAEISGLAAYFQSNVIVGADSFVETALGFDDYAKSMARKLERELETLVLGRIEAPARP